MKKLYVVGIGAGAKEGMTLEAQAALEHARVIVGYSLYVELVKPYLEGKEYIDTPMRKEVDRCIMALECAEKGGVVAVVCSGDSGVYGMAGLIYELSEKYDVDIEVIPGVTAAISGAAVLGAPLTHDFAVISLSDLLTPMELIEKRLECAAMGDFCMAIYNPSSKKRKDYLENACKILLKHKSADTVCGYVKNIGREGEEAHITTLAELMNTEVDMFTTVFVGNAQTTVIDGKMVTPRGYRIG